jgi:twitching motility protein PilT
MNIQELLQYVVVNLGSDLHLSTGMPPLIRVDNELQRVEGAASLTEENINAMLYEVLPTETLNEMAAVMDMDFAVSVEGLNFRFRVNIFHQSRGISVAFRAIPLKVPTIAELGLPDVFYRLSNLENGLILLTGPTGCGKSTTLAAMIDYINEGQHAHILTIEDPIEYLHTCKKCLIQQREVKKHTISFDDALRSALREDPDYILVGEMRDLETIRLALTAAETGHLVFTTLHTRSSAESVDRIVDAFPTHEKSMIRSMLANSLQAVCSQLLVKKIGGGRVAAHEIMICTSAIRNMIRENKIAQIYSAIQTGQNSGMQTLDQSLQELINHHVIDGSEYRDLLFSHG